MPGEGLTHGPPAKRMQAAGTTGKAEHAGIPCAMVFTLIRSLPGAPGLLATIRDNALTHIARDTSIGVSGRCDFTSAIMPVVCAKSASDMARGHRIRPRRS